MNNILYAVYEVGPQGVLVDTGHRSTLENSKQNIENCFYGFKAGKEYVCFPVFKGKDK